MAVFLPVQHYISGRQTKHFLTANLVIGKRDSEKLPISIIISDTELIELLICD